MRRSALTSVSVHRRSLTGSSAVGRHPRVPEPDRNHDSLVARVEAWAPGTRGGGAQFEPMTLKPPEAVNPPSTRASARIA